LAAADPSRIVLSAPDLGQAERDALLATFDDGWISSAAPLVERFEQAFAEAVGLEAATAVSSGTAALQLALHMLDLRPRRRGVFGCWTGSGRQVA
jgi:perosamine synthetase